MYEDRLNAALAVNPKALEEADAARSRARAGQVRGPLHGIPDRAEGQHPHHQHADDRRRAGVRRIRAAVRGDADEEPARRGRDHHREDRTDRTGELGRRQSDADARQLQRGRRLRVQPVRSAARSARRDRSTAGRCCRPAARAPASAPRRISGRRNVGTDTGGSVISPSNANMLVGIRPTIGRISRYGVIPITADHDTAGPMTRTVADAAIMLGALEGAVARSATTRRHDVHAAAGSRLHEIPATPTALKGARIGVPRAFYYRSRHAARRRRRRAAASTPSRPR